MTRPTHPDGSVIMDEHVTAEHIAELAAEVERLKKEKAIQYEITRISFKVTKEINTEIRRLQAENRELRGEEHDSDQRPPYDVEAWWGAGSEPGEDATENLRFARYAMKRWGAMQEITCAALNLGEEMSAAVEQLRAKNEELRCLAVDLFMYAPPDVFASWNAGADLIFRDSEPCIKTRPGAFDADGSTPTNENGDQE